MAKLKIFALAVQHLLAMYAGAIVVPLIVGKALAFTDAQITYLVSVDLLMCGVATLLQTLGGRFIGVGLPVVMGCTFTAVAPMIAIGTQYGLGHLYGAIIAAGALLVAGGRWLGLLGKFFPPVVTGSVVSIIGMTLIPVAMRNIAGGAGNTAFGSPENLALGFAVFAFILLVHRLGRGFVRAIAVLSGIVCGTLAAAVAGWVSPAAVEQAAWFQLAQPFAIATPVFAPAAIFIMFIVALVSIVEATGVYLALADICGKPLDARALTRGYRAEGVAMMLGGAFNAFPYTTYAQNVGLVELTGVKDRSVVFTCGGLLIMLGCIPKVAAVTTMIPAPVLGGGMLVMFGMVMAYGIKILSRVDFDRHENMLVVACSLGLGLGATAVPTLFAQLPAHWRILVDNGIVVGSLSAVVLHAAFGGLKPTAPAAAARSAGRAPGRLAEPTRSSSASPDRCAVHGPP